MESVEDEQFLTRDRYPQLYPPTQVFNTVYTESEIFTPSANSSYPTRKIFYNTQFTDAETLVLNKLKSNLEYEHIDLPFWWSPNDSLRFLSEFNFESRETIERIKEHSLFLQKINSVRYENFVEGSRIIELINSGVLYQYGRDLEFRPIVI